MRFYVGDFGTVPIQFVDEAGNVIDLTGRTTQWDIRNRDGSVPAVSPLIGIPINETNGEVVFDFPVDLTTEKTRYTSIMRILESGVFIKSTATPIRIDVDNIGDN